MLIVYCETCGRRLIDDEVKSGSARKIDENQYLCAQCAPSHQPRPASSPTLQNTSSGKVATVSISEVEEPSKVRTRSTARNRRASTGANTIERAPSGGRNPVQQERERAAPKKQGHPAMLYAGVGGAALVLIVVIAATMGGSKPVAVQEDKVKEREKSEKAVPPPPLSPAAKKELPPTPVVTPPPEKKNPQEPQTASKPVKNDMEDFRSTLAEEKLKEAQDWYARNQKDPWGYSDKLNDVVNTYRSTPAGTKAKDLLAGLKLPPRPAPVELPLVGTGSWTALFDGKNLDKLNPQSAGGWKLEQGKLVNVPNTHEAGQFLPEMANVEIRIRFELQGDVEYLSFRALQGGQGSVGVTFTRPEISAMGAGPHELLIQVRSAKALKASLDGKAVPANSDGEPVSGKVQIRCKTGKLLISSMDYRPLADAPQK